MESLFANLNHAVEVAMEEQPRLRAEYEDESARASLAVKLVELLDRFDLWDDRRLAASDVSENSRVPVARILAMAYGYDDRSIGDVELDVNRVAEVIEDIQRPTQSQSQSY